MKSNYCEFLKKVGQILEEDLGKAMRKGNEELAHSIRERLRLGRPYAYEAAMENALLEHLGQPGANVESILESFPKLHKPKIAGSREGAESFWERVQSGQANTRLADRAYALLAQIGLPGAPIKLILDWLTENIFEPEKTSDKEAAESLQKQLDPGWVRLFKTELEGVLHQTLSQPGVDVRPIVDWLTGHPPAERAGIGEIIESIEITKDGAGRGDSPLETALSDLQTMRQHYEHYNPKTAKDIIDAIFRANLIWSEEGGRWGPTVISKVCAIHPTTIGRYLKAFKRIGLTHVDGVKIP